MSSYSHARRVALIKRAIKKNEITYLRVGAKGYDTTHAIRRENDECACSCGKRWPSDETHP